MAVWQDRDCLRFLGSHACCWQDASLAIVLRNWQPAAAPQPARRPTPTRRRADNQQRCVAHGPRRLQRPQPRRQVRERSLRAVRPGRPYRQRHGAAVKPGPLQVGAGFQRARGAEGKRRVAQRGASVPSFRTCSKRQQRCVLMWGGKRTGRQAGSPTRGGESGTRAPLLVVHPLAATGNDNVAASAPAHAYEMPLMLSSGRGTELAFAGLWAGSKLITCPCRCDGQRHGSIRWCDKARRVRRAACVYICPMSAVPTSICFHADKRSHSQRAAALPGRSRRGDTRGTATARLALPPRPAA